jgi:hypothetical protein
MENPTFIIDIWDITTTATTWDITTATTTTTAAAAAAATWDDTRYVRDTINITTHVTDTDIDDLDDYIDDIDIDDSDDIDSLHYSCFNTTRQDGCCCC